MHMSGQTHSIVHVATIQYIILTLNFQLYTEAHKPGKWWGDTLHQWVSWARSHDLSCYECQKPLPRHSVGHNRGGGCGLGPRHMPTPGETFGNWGQGNESQSQCINSTLCLIDLLLIMYSLNLTLAHRHQNMENECTHTEREWDQFELHINIPYRK